MLERSTCSKHTIVRIRLQIYAVSLEDVTSMCYCYFYVSDLTNDVIAVDAGVMHGAPI